MIDVPPSTRRDLNNAMDAALAANRALQRASDLLAAYAPRLQFLAAHLAEQTSDLREKVEALRDGTRVVASSPPDGDHVTPESTEKPGQAPAPPPSNTPAP